MSHPRLMLLITNGDCIVSRMANLLEIRFMYLARAVIYSVEIEEL